MFTPPSVTWRAAIEAEYTDLLHAFELQFGTTGMKAARYFARSPMQAAYDVR